MALEYVEGRNLREYLARKGPPEAMLALSIMRQVAAALQRAAEMGIVHRDIKPENILLTRRGEVKVADFGLSRCLASDQQPLNLTQSGVTMGTPLYMSPEQVEGKPLDPRTDIYSFGVTCYHMLAGQPPFRGQSAFEVALQHVRADAEPLSTLRPDLPLALCFLVHKMMAKKPEERYQTCGELLRDLARVRDSLNEPGGGVQGEAVTLEKTELAPVTSVAPAAAKSEDAGRTTGPTRTGLPEAAPVQRRLRFLVAATVLLALLLGAGAGVGWLRLRARSHPLPSVGGTGEAGELTPLFSEAEREKFLLQAVERYANPGGDPSRIRLGLGHAIELALFYLERHRLDEAERFFARLESPDQKVPRYRNLGRLGRAMVLAFRDRPVESNDLFKQLLDVKTERERVLQSLQINQNPWLRLWIGRALEHNYQNATAEHPFPAQLDFLRKPPGAQPPRRASDKPLGRKP
jgi:serine/threonine-protein kinase